MKLLMDGIVFENSHQRGIQRYYYELLKRTVARDDISVTLLLRGKPQINIPEGCRLLSLREPFASASSNLPVMLKKLRQSLFPTRISKADLFHSTYYTRSPVKKTNEVVTVYDMIAETYPYHLEFDPTETITRKRECIKKAKGIITISETTRQELIKIYPEVANRTHAIPLGMEHLSRQVDPATHPTKDEEGIYVLFVGSRMGYKNFYTLMNAMSEPTWPAEVRLVLAGHGYTKGETMALKHRGLLGRISNVRRVDDATLKRLYANAAGFIFPSLAEGFGFPFLEAQSLGVPVIASDIPIFREIGGNSFLPFSPLDSHQLAQAVRSLLAPDVRSRLLDEAQANLQRFSWDRCAEQTVEVWKKYSS